MFIPNMPNVPLQQAPVIVLAQAAQPSTKELYGTVGVCYLSPIAEQINPKRDQEGYYDVNPRAYANNIFSFKPLADSQFLGYETAEVNALQSPQHGALSNDLSPSKGNTSYYPKSGYEGKDKVVFLVNIGGYKVKVVYFIKVNALYDRDSHPHVKMYDKYCPHTNPWKISSTLDANGNSTVTAVDYLPFLSN